MPDLFLPGPFAEADLLAAILGSGAASLELRPAALVDHALRTDRRGARVALASAPGHDAAGAVVRAGEAAAARLGFAMCAMAPGAGGRTGRTSAGLAQVFVTDVPPPDPWPAAPEREWRAHLAEAAGEAMSQFGRRSAAETAALIQGISYRALARVRGSAETGPVRRRAGLAAAGDVEPLALARPYARYFGVEEHRLRHRRFDGRMSGPMGRAVFTSGDAVTVLPFDPRRRLVLLIEQFRAGPHARRDPHPWCLEAVAGRCDAGEGPEATARREALEEAGLRLGRMERAAGYYTSPGTMAEHITAFVGEAALDPALGGVFGLPEEDEDIRVLVVPLVEAMELVAAGEVNNGPLLVSLLWLARQADRLAAAWAEGA
jgi:nudix-type nucleoside diphosphatase (YffH/AdpP family)